jgi:hypothetical protein
VLIIPIVEKKIVEKNIGSFQSSYFHFLVCRFLDNLVHDDLACLVVLLTWPCQFLSTVLPLFLSTSLLSCSDSLFLPVIKGNILSKQQKTEKKKKKKMHRKEESKYTGKDGFGKDDT